MRTRQKTVRLNGKSPKNKIVKVRRGTPFVHVDKHLFNLRNIGAGIGSSRVASKQILQFQESREIGGKPNSMVVGHHLKNKGCDITANLPKSYNTFVKPINNNEIANSTFQDISANSNNENPPSSFEQNSKGNQVSLCGSPEICRQDNREGSSLHCVPMSTITERPFEHQTVSVAESSPQDDLNRIHFCSVSRDIGVQTETFQSKSTTRGRKRRVHRSQGILRNNNLRQTDASIFQGKKTHIKIYAQEVYIENYINKG